jgi:hypothetical protein
VNHEDRWEWTSTVWKVKSSGALDVVALEVRDEDFDCHGAYLECRSRDVITALNGVQEII